MDVKKNADDKNKKIIPPNQVIITLETNIPGYDKIRYSPSMTLKNINQKNVLFNPLIKLNQNTKKVWKSILQNNGSVQHLDFLSEHEKAVFKTFSEVSQVDVIKLAAQRQKYIDMGQSINLMIHPDTPAKDINKLYLLAYDEGVKTLYYQYSINAAQEFNKSLLECSACEG